MNTLQGYSVVRWPELAANRHPSDEFHVASKRVIVTGEALEIKSSVLLVSIARIIAAYCSISDLLLAIECPSEVESIRVLRIKWDENKTWREAIAEVDILLATPSIETPSLSAARELLSTEHPCLAFCTFNGKTSSLSSSLPCRFTYDTSTGTVTLVSPVSILHPTVAEQLVEQVVELAINVVQHPEERFTVITPFNPNLMSVYDRIPDDTISTIYPHIPPVLFAPDYLKTRAEDMPTSLAVRWYSDLSFEQSLEPESVTYLDLHRRSDQVAHWLLGRGLNKEDRVGVCLDRNLHFHAVMMGIMRAGGCYVPIDPELPLERKSYIAKDAGVAFVLTSSQLVAPSVFGSKGIFFEDDDVQSEIAQQPTTHVEGIMEPEGLAYMLYTSGTTGNPKGCLLTHRGLAQAILALSSTAADVRMDNIHDGRYLAVASIAFDVHLAETIVPMALGMPLLSAQRSQLLENLPKYVGLLGVTHLGIVPSLIEATLNASQNGKGSSGMTLRYIASGGEKMSDAILDKWADHPQVRLANFYGPSEVTIGCCARYMSSTTPRANIGKPLANVSAYVVDDKLNVLPRGAPGELVVEGPLVGRGYHGREDLTAKVFMEWPHNGCWAYRTGDLVRMMPDSTIEILGRIDTQIKLRGVRIESEGISAIIRGAVPASQGVVLEAVTILAKHPAIAVEQLVSLFSWQMVPVATRKSQLPSVTPPPPGMLTQIKAKCIAELANYMRPSHFVPLSWLPLSSNGKTDAKRLAQLFNNIDIDVLAGLSSIDCDDATRACTQTEHKIFEVLSRYVSLPFKQPRPDMSIFECGLDSMSVIRFTSELRTVLGSPLSASDVMKFPLLAEIATLAEKAASVGESENSSTLETHSIPQELYSEYDNGAVQLVIPPFPCQEGVLSRSIEQDTLYVQHVLVALGTHVSLARLRNAWKAIAIKHSILRTVFYFGRRLYQVTLANPNLNQHWDEHPWPCADSTSFSDYFLQNQGPSIVKQINSQLSSVPPYRLNLYSTLDGQRFLTLSIHHSLFDGISLPLLFDDVEREYGGGLPSQELFPTPADILSQIPFNLTRAETFWKAEFDGFVWPTPAFSQTTSNFALRCVVPFKVSLSHMRSIASAHHVTLQALLTCAFANVLAREVYGSKDVVFGVLRSGRLVQVEGIDSAMCPLVSVVPMRVNLDSASILRDIQSKIASLVDFEHVSLGKVQSWIRPGQHIFEVLFSLSVKKNISSILWDVVESEPPRPDYPLAVEVVLDPATDSLSIQAAWSNHNQTGHIHQWLHNFEETVQQLAQGPTTYMASSLSTLDGTRRQTPSPVVARTGAIPSAPIDPILFQLLRRVTADFMQISPDVLTPTTSLISMGLDSIKSVGLAKVMVKEGLSVTSTDLLQAGTFAAIATRISLQEHTDVMEPDYLLPDFTSEFNLDDIRLSVKDEVEIFPTTALQAGMLSQTVNSGGKLYVHAFPLVLRSNIDTERLQEAWKRTISAVAILRTSFHFLVHSGTWVQVVHSDVMLSWSRVLVNSVDEYRTQCREFLSSIDMPDEGAFSKPPFWIRSFSVIDSAQTYLVLVMHHALYDGISVGKLLDVVEEFYKDDPPVLRKQFHELLPQFIRQEGEGSQIWIDRLRRYHPCRLSPLHPSIQRLPVFVEKSFTFDQAQFASLLRRAGVTPQCVAQASWVKIIARETKCRDVVFGHTVSGRNSPASEEVIGPVLNTVPFMIQLGRYMQNIELLRGVHESNIDSLGWHHASLRDIQKRMAVESLWDSLFLYQSHSDDEGVPKHWETDSGSLEDDPKIQYPLNVEIHQRHGSFTIQCASRSDYFDQEGLLRLASDLQSFIERMICKPDSPIIHDLLNIFDNPALPRIHSGGSIEIAQGNDDDLVVDVIPYQQMLAQLSNTPISKINARTPLVALGIDSITAIQISSKLRSSGLKIATTEIINSRTVGEMVMKIRPLHTSKDPKLIPSITLRASEVDSIRHWLGARSELVERFSFASPGMKWLISSWQRSGGTRYHHTFAFQLPSTVDVERLRLAWFQLVKKHWLLRSTFCFVGGLEDVRIVTFKEAEENSWMDGGDVSPLLEQMKALLSRPPVLRLPQARALFLKASNHLVLHLHHFQYDAWSLALIVDDLASFYHDIPPQASSNVDAFVMHYSQREDHARVQQEYWRRLFPPDQFMPAYVTPFLNSHVAHTHKRVIKTKYYPKLSTVACSSAANVHEVSLQSICLACWSQIQAEITTSPTTTFGLWHSGRTGPVEDIDRLAAPCINVLPIRVVVSEEESLLDLARRLQSELQGRSDVVEQSELAMVSRSAGLLDKAICNVSINIIKTASSLQSSAFLVPVEVPYWVPEYASTTLEEIQELPLTPWLRDDIMVDIAVTDASVIMSIDAAAHMMNGTIAEALMDRWADKVEKVINL